MRFYTICIICSLVSTYSFAQAKVKKERFPSYFGLVVSPVIPSNFIGTKETSFKDSSGLMNVNFQHQWGFTFGAIARFGLTKTISLETGISQVRRNFNVNVQIPDSTINDDQQLTFVNYDIPINGLIYVQLSDKWYMNGAVGVSITHYPSDVKDSMLPGDKQRISIEGRRIHRTYFAANAGLGFEYRTEKYGTFYLGGGAKVPFDPVFFGVGIYTKSGNGNRLIAYEPISAAYFTLDFRYFFPKTKRKETTKPSLIE